MKQYVQDKYGNVIYLTDERWEHIVERHPVLKDHKEKVLSVVRSSDHSRHDVKWNVFLYRKAFVEVSPLHTHIEVAVVFDTKLGQPNNFIVTAYPTS